MIETLPTPEPEVTRRRWTRKEYHKAAELGLFGPDERLELIHGEVYQKMAPQKSGHFFVITALYHALTRAFGEGFTVRQQGPALFGQHSEPEPDIGVYPGKWQDFAFHHPRLSDAVLIVEVSDTTLRTDRTLKASLHAEAGVQDVWIVNVNARTVEVRRQPTETPHKAFPFGYRSVRSYAEEETIVPLATPDRAVAVRGLLPPA